MSHNEPEETRQLAELSALQEICKNLKATDPLKDIGREVAFICHEIKNCSMVLASYAVLLQKSQKIGDDERGMVDGMAEAAVKLHDFTRRVSDLSKSVFFTRKHVEFDLVQTIKSCIENRFKEHAQKFSVTCAAAQESVTIFGSFADIEKAFAAIFANALEAGAQNIRITLRVSNRTVLVTIDDDGAGCDIAHLNKLRDDLFFSTKGSDVNCGLGLPLAYSIIECHGGKISIYAKNILGNSASGLSVQLVFQAGADTPHVALRSEIMLIGDGIENLPVIMKILKNLKITPRTVATFEEANIASHSTALGLIVFAAPQSAAQVAEIAKERPHIKVFEITGGENGGNFAAADKLGGGKTVFCEDFVLACLSAT